MDTESNDIKNLDNDFNHLGRLDGVNGVTVDQHGIHSIEIKHPGNFLIKIIVPDKIFEWFVFIYDDQKNELVRVPSYEYYDEPEEVMKADLQKDVEDYVHDILNHKLRLILSKRLFREIYTVEIFRDNNWTELASDSKLKIF